MSAKPLKSRSGKTIVLPTHEENARIQASLNVDPETPELDAAWFARARPAAEALPPAAYCGLLALKRRPGERGPQKAPTKERISIRLSREVADYFRATGEGWQTRIDEALRDYVARRR